MKKQLHSEPIPYLIYIAAVFILLTGLLTGIFAVVQYNKPLDHTAEREFDTALMETQDLNEESRIGFLLHWKKTASAGDLGYEYYLNATNSSVHSNEYLRLSNNQNAIWFSGTLTLDFLRHPEVFRKLKEAKPVNSNYFTRFFLMEKYSLLFLAALGIGAGTWGYLTESGIYDYIRSTAYGNKYLLLVKRRLYLSGIAFVVITHILSLTVSGFQGWLLFAHEQIRSYSANPGYFFHYIPVSMTWLEYLSIDILSEVLNYVCIVRLCYLLAVRTRNTVRTLSYTGLLLACIWIFNHLLANMGIGFMILIGYIGDPSFWISKTRYIEFAHTDSIRLNLLVQVLLFCILHFFRKRK